MKSPQSFLLSGTALLALIVAQQPADGADSAHALLLAQSAPQQAAPQNAKTDQTDKDEHGRKRPHKAPDKDKKDKKAQKPEAKGQPKAAQSKKPAAAASPDAKADAKKKSKPDAAAQKKNADQSAQPAQAKEYDRGQHDKNRKKEHPAAAQQRAPAAAPSQPGKPKEGQAKRPPAPATLKKEQVQQQPAASQKPVADTMQKRPQNGARNAAGAPPQPTKPRDTSEFIRRKGATPSKGLDEVRKHRRETRVGNRLVIHEGDRTIERENNRTIIRHSEAERFAIGARRVDVQHHGDQTVTVVLRPDGVRIVSTTDRHGHLIRRVRRDPRGRDIVIIDNSVIDPRRRAMFIDLRPPRVRDRGRYIIDAGRANRARIYAVFTAPPIERLDRHYTVEQVRYSYPLREYMPRVDLDIHFDTGSWQLTPDQIGRLSEIAAALNQVIDRNPREVFLIEGHTDAVGSKDDNLSLSDRRAETVAVVLTEEFHVPSENLVTQGYGEEHLKVQTEGANRANRRVAVRRITPLIAHAER